MLHEYDTVRAMYGVGKTTAAQLMAEISDVRRFPRRSSIVGFAGVDPAVNQSGKHEVQNTPTAKCGSPHLRKALYQIVCTYPKKSPAEEPVPIAVIAPMPITLTFFTCASPYRSSK